MTTTAVAPGVHARRHAVRVGWNRGVAEFRQSLRSPEDLGFYFTWTIGILVYFFFNRNETFGETSLTIPTVVMPGILAAMLVFGAIVGPGFQLVVEREDGTLLRAKSAPHGMTGYVTGQLVIQSLGVLPMLVLLLVPGVAFLGVTMYRGWLGWLAVLVILVIGLAALLPVGLVIGSLARKPSHVSTWGLLPVLGMAAISGIFAPITALASWVQTIAQVFPMYWLGHAMRWAFLPDEAAALELGGEWRLGLAFAVIAAWGAVGLLLAPRILRRMARRESGSAVQARFEQRLQRYG